MRRRGRQAASGVALALVLAAGTTALVMAGGATRPAPSESPSRVPTWTPGLDRPMAYGQEQTLHLGERAIDTGLDFLSIDLSDDRTALTTFDGGIWFTDGAPPERIGTTLGGRPSPQGVGWPSGSRPRDWVAGDSEGSLVAWLEFPAQRDRPELVVYDSATRTVVGRRQIEVADDGARVVAVAGGAVFVAGDGNGWAPRFLRYDVDSGALDPARARDVEDARRRVDPLLLVGLSADSGAPLAAPTQVSDFTTTVETLDVRGGMLDRLRDPRTGEPVEITVPDENEGEERLWFTQWLDDDRFVLASSIGKPTGDLLVCRIAAGRCDLVINRETWGDVLLPGNGGVGSELALGPAIRAARTR